MQGEDGKANHNPTDQQAGYDNSALLDGLLKTNLHPRNLVRQDSNDNEGQNKDPPQAQELRKVGVARILLGEKSRRPVRNNSSR